jgi:HAD superfamily hydrolase (TIGR01662 family)
MKAVFLDKDGSLADELPCKRGPDRITLRNGADAALRLLSRLDYRLFVVTDRAGAPDMEAVHDRLRDLLSRERLTLDGFYCCPHRPERGIGARDCHCRKPMPGLLLQAAHEHGIDLRASWMIGDILHDVEAGNRAGCRTVLLDKGSETEWRLGPRRIPTRMAPDLYAAAVLIASHGDIA